VDPPLLSPSNLVVPATISTDAFPQPHKGDPITLSNTKLGVSIPASLLQLGVGAGLVKDGMTVPATVTLVVTGQGTTEGTHQYVVKDTVTVHVVDGQAEPLSATVSLPNTTWHPKNATDDVLFSEKSLHISAFVNLLGGITATFDCAPAGSAQFVALAAQSSTVPTTTTVAAVVTPTGSSTLPRTGASTLLLLVVAPAAIDGGVTLIALTRRRVRRIG